jgi:hypothetical protein
MSYISCQAHTVLTAAKNRIKEIEAERMKRDEVEISRVMLMKHFWSKKLFTRDEAINYLKSHGDFCGWRSFYAWGTEETLRNLILLAENGNPVFVDEAGAKALWS